jgi:hypothetical protein
MKINTVLKLVLGITAGMFVNTIDANAASDKLPEVKWQDSSVESGELSYVFSSQANYSSANARSNFRSSFKSGTYKLNVEMSFAQSVDVDGAVSPGIELTLKTDPLVLSAGDFTAVNANAKAYLDPADTAKASVRMLYSWQDKSYRLGVKPVNGGGLEFYVTSVDSGTTKVITKFLASEPEVWTLDKSVSLRSDFVINPGATSCADVTKNTFQILEVKHGSEVLLADKATTVPAGYNFVCPSKQIISSAGGVYRFSRGSYLESITGLSTDKNVLVGSGGYKNAYYSSLNPTLDAVIVQGSSPVVAGEINLLSSNDWSRFVSSTDASGALVVSALSTLEGMKDTARVLIPYVSNKSQILFCPNLTTVASATNTCSGLVVYDQTASDQQFVSSNGKIFWSLPYKGGVYSQTSGFKPGGEPGGGGTTGSGTGTGSTGTGTGTGTGSGSGTGTNGTSGTGTTGNTGSGAGATPPVVTGVLGTSATFPGQTTPAASPATTKGKVLGASASLANTGTGLVGVMAASGVLLLSYTRLTKRTIYKS